MEINQSKMNNSKQSENTNNRTFNGSYATPSTLSGGKNRKYYDFSAQTPLSNTP